MGRVRLSPPRQVRFLTFEIMTATRNTGGALPATAMRPCLLSPLVLPVDRGLTADRVAAGLLGSMMNGEVRSGTGNEYAVGMPSPLTLLLADEAIIVSNTEQGENNYNLINCTFKVWQTDAT